MGEDITNLLLENNEAIGECEDYKYLRINFNQEEADNTQIITKVSETRKVTKIPVEQTGAQN